MYNKLEVTEAYTKALRTWAQWVDANIDSNRTRVFFRGFSASHFRYIINLILSPFHRNFHGGIPVMGLCLTVELQRWAVEFRWKLRRRDAADNKRDPAFAISMDDEDP